MPLGPLGPALALCKNTYSDRVKRPPASFEKLILVRSFRVDRPCSTSLAAILDSMPLFGVGFRDVIDPKAWPILLLWQKVSEYENEMPQSHTADQP